MEHLGAEQTRDLLPYRALADELRAMLDERRAGSAHAPPRTIVPLPGGGTLLLMPATSASLTSVKLVTVHSDNAARGLPSVQARYWRSKPPPAGASCCWRARPLRRGAPLPCRCWRRNCSRRGRMARC